MSKSEKEGSRKQPASTSEKEDSRQRPAGQKEQPSIETRVDAPHVISKPSERPSKPIAAEESVAEQLRAQADQLAAYLRGRQRELDHRESQVNARIATLESDARTARLWLREREAELDRRQEDLDAKQLELKERLARFADDEAARREQDDVSERQGVSERQEDFDQRIGRLQEADAQLGDIRSRAEQLHRELHEARCDVEQQGRVQQQRMATQQRQAETELQKRRQAVQRRGEHVDRCKTALEQLRAELGRMHRETLEIRLATEELWVQLSGAAPPAALTRSLGRIRTKLAEQYRTANAELHAQKDDLKSIRGQLAQQHEKLLKQKLAYEQWVAQRQDESEQQAARLIAREEQLTAKEAEFADRDHHWQAERLGHLQEITRLRSRLEEVPVPA